MNSTEALQRIMRYNQVSGCPEPDCSACRLNAEARAVLESDAQALADVRTLDDWAHIPFRNRYHIVDKVSDTRFVCFLRAGEGDQEFEGPTPDAARRAAAEWVRGQKDREWDAVAMTNSPRRKP